MLYQIVMFCRRICRQPNKLISTVFLCLALLLLLMTISPVSTLSSLCFQEFRPLLHFQTTTETNFQYFWHKDKVFRPTLTFTFSPSQWLICHKIGKWAIKWQPLDCIKVKLSLSSCDFLLTVIVNAPKFSHTMDNINERIEYKLLSLRYKILTQYM